MAPRRRKSRPVKRRARGFSGVLALTLVAAALLVVVMIGLSKIPHSGGKATSRPHLSMQEARAFNGSIPFLAGPLPPARPFLFRGSPAARLQARECLATAALYEAGHDVRGQRAVMQVVLNRVQTRGFPKTVCGVVYQGAALPTGCQFSFTCDRSLVRRPEHSGWAEARQRATKALAGAVFRPIGAATHYHADWIVPYWMSALDKLAQVHSHIFYRVRR